jgi:hypothetical protein
MPTPAGGRPEDRARANIDRLLAAAGWLIQNRDSLNIEAGCGVAIREFPLAPGHGFADYLLYIDGYAAGVIEAKKEGVPLIAVEIQTGKYSQGLPQSLPAPRRPLPFCYQSTGIDTRFTNLLEPDARVGANTGDACAVLEELDQHYVCQSVALLRPVLTQTSKYLLFWLLASRAGAGYFKKCLYGQGRPHLGFDQIKRTPVLVPPLDVMNAIVARIEDQLSLAEAVAATVEDSKCRAARLRQAILHKAFAGKLVPQDPNDEPASFLLGRIRAARR